MKAIRLTRPPRKAAATDAAVARVMEKKIPNNHPLLPPSKGGEIKGGSIPVVGAARKKEEKATVGSGHTAATLLEAALALTPAQQRELLAQLALRTQESGNEPSRDKDMWSTSVHGALLAVVGLQDRASAAPMLVRRAMGASAAWLPVVEFMEASGLDRLKVVERQAVYEFLARLLIKRCREVAQHVKAPLSPKLVAGQAQGLAALFEVEFPGYLAAGLAGIVAKRIISGYQPPAEPADSD